MPDYARIAYEAWAAHQRWQDTDCAVIPKWPLLEQDLKDAWEAGIDAAFNAQIPGDAP